MKKNKKLSILDLVSQTPPEEKLFEKAVEKVHKLSSMPEENKEPTVRLTIDLPKSMHKTLKILVIGESVTIKDFAIQAITEKLGKVSKG
jgi:ribosomal protein L1